MINSPLVSVICLCYNHEKFVKEAIKSVLCQSYSNIQLIVVDDASTDGSKNVIAEMLEGTSTEFITLHSNLGNTKAFNKGFAKAKGKYIIDLSADDVLIQNRVEKQVAFFEECKQSIGVIYSDAIYIDEEGNELPALSRGELLIRGTAVFRGYWNRPDANAETFLPGGWMRTGDVAYLDEEGYLFIVDRIKDLVIRGGENIGCGEVEAALLEHPLIHEASVYAVPDERLGEEVGTTIYTDQPIDEEELNAFLLTRLARFKVPAHTWQQHEPLPRTASGKILKRDLREEACLRLTT